MPIVNFERKDSKLFMTVSEQGSSRTLLKILGESQITQLLDIATDLLPERALFPSASERNIVTNDEYDFLPLDIDGEIALYRLIIRNGATSFDQYDFTLSELRVFVDALTEIRYNDLFTKSQEIGPPITSAQFGPTGPIGPTGPRGPSGTPSFNQEILVVKLADQEAEDTDLVTDDELQFPICAGEMYIFDIFLFIEADTVDPDLKLTVIAPGITVLFKVWFVIHDNTDNSVGPNGVSGIVIDNPGDVVEHAFVGSLSSVIKSVARIAGSVQADSVSGTVAVQFAQNTGSSVPIRVTRGSVLVAKKV